MNAALSLIGYFLLSVGILFTLARMDGVPFWGTMVAGFVLAGIGLLFVLRRFSLDASHPGDALPLDAPGATSPLTALPSDMPGRPPNPGTPEPLAVPPTPGTPSS